MTVGKLNLKGMCATVYTITAKLTNQFQRSLLIRSNYQEKMELLKLYCFYKILVFKENKRFQGEISHIPGDEIIKIKMSIYLGKNTPVPFPFFSW